MSIFWTNCVVRVRLLSSSSSNFDSCNVVDAVVRHCYQLFNGLHLRQRRRWLAGHWTLQCRKREKTDTERKTKTKSTQEKEKEERFLNVFD